MQYVVVITIIPQFACMYSIYVDLQQKKREVRYFEISISIIKLEWVGSRTFQHSFIHTAPHKCSLMRFCKRNKGSNSGFGMPRFRMPKKIFLCKTVWTKANSDNTELFFPRLANARSVNFCHAHMFSNRR